MKKEELFKKLYKVKPDDKILLITHIDLDGSGPVVVLKKFFKNVTVTHCANSAMSWLIRKAVTEDMTNDGYDCVIACDTSVNEADAKLIEESPNKTKFCLIDHHATADFLNQYDWAAVESNLVKDSYRAYFYKGISDDKQKSSSGTSLLYDYIDYLGYSDHNPEFEAFVHMIASYDTWDWKNTFTDAECCYDLNSLFQIYGYEIFDRVYTERYTTMTPSEIEAFNKQNELLLEIEKNKRDNFLKFVDRNFQTGSIKIGEKFYSMCLWSGAGTYMNDVFDRMKEHWPDRDLYIMCYGTGISIRTDDENINIGELCKQFGGGGHAAAGGFKIPDDLQIGYAQTAITGSTMYIDH